MSGQSAWGSRQQPGEILVTLAVEVPQDRVFAEELELFETHLAGLIQELFAAETDQAA